MPEVHKPDTPANHQLSFQIVISNRRFKFRYITIQTAMERNTKQKQAVRAVLESAERPLTAEEAHARAARHIPGIGMATVYRTIRTFVNSGLVHAVEVPGETPCYEITGKGHHHHFLCRACERVFEAGGCADGDDLLAAPPGFRVEGHEVVLRGVCVECVSEPAPAMTNKKSSGKRIKQKSPRTTRGGRAPRRKPTGH